jgi:hypothetical protein
MRLGEGVSFQRLAIFSELNLDVSVQIFAPGAASFRVWADTTEPLNSTTYFKSHVAITGNFEMTMKYIDHTEEKIIIEPCKSWPHQEYRAGFRQVVGHPEEIEKGGENFCVMPIEKLTHSLSVEQFDLNAGESKIIGKGKLLMAYGPEYTINGIVRGTIDGPWSLTACVNNEAHIAALEACRIIVYQSVPLET